MFLYSLTPEHGLVRFSEMYSIHPLDDAFTASMKALLRKACEVRTSRHPIVVANQTAAKTGL